ncbi:hypothetical protein Golomagni_06904 [Golovinomyces magnicellulatus]|nr:hypothetical protein Golomagni_06904 [Golovinomyces magnicellulatus]
MATPEHCIVCFDALDADLDDRKPLTFEAISSSWATYTAASAPIKDANLARVAAEVNSSSSSSSSSTSLSPSTGATSATSLPTVTETPLFVTWNTLEDEDDDEDVALRGCIGTFEAQPLATGLPEYALISALQDHRFPPISRRELPTLQVAVTLLTDFEEVEDPYDWDIGTHGLRLSFHDRGRRYGSTYLPDVAPEQGWDKDETLYSLTRKAGWVGSRSKWADLNLKVTRYQGKKATMNYTEYKKWKDSQA